MQVHEPNPVLAAGTGCPLSSSPSMAVVLWGHSHGGWRALPTHCRTSSSQGRAPCPCGLQGCARGLWPMASSSGSARGPCQAPASRLGQASVSQQWGPIRNEMFLLGYFICTLQ